MRTGPAGNVATPRHLRLATDPAGHSHDTTSDHDGAATPTQQAWTVARPALLRVCAGEPMVLDDAEVDLVALINRAQQIQPFLLDDSLDPDHFRLAEVLIEHLCQRYGIQRRGKGDRFKNLESIYRRHLLPFVIELEASLPAEHQGVAALRLRHLEKLPAILAGDAPLPAATIAGDHLDRRGIACIFLDVGDAAQVVRGGARALEVALSEARVPLHRDARTGRDIVRAADLRATGLLQERTTPHGCAESTAGNVLRDLKDAIHRAHAHGAAVRGTFNLTATAPLPANRLRTPRLPAAHVPLRDIAATAPYLPPIGQVVLWLERLTGDRISETYGPRVCDYWRDPNGQGWLRIAGQGGLSSLGRNPETGQFEHQDSKDHTKTAAGVRTIPLPRQLARLLDCLIAVFHIDADTGEVDPEARLIPGIRSENTSGQSAFRSWLKAAQKQAATGFLPHDLRGALITDLKNAGIEQRIAHYYAGHELPDGTIQDESYDHGPDLSLLLPIARLLEQRLEDDLRTDDLRAPTKARESWGRATRRHRQRDWIEQQLADSGWRASEPGGDGRGRQLSVREVAARIGKSYSRAKALMVKGEIVATTVAWESRDVWVANESDVQRYLDRLDGTTLADLATDIGMGYHPLWCLARELNLLEAGHHRGAKIRLTGDAAERLRTEVSRRREALAQVVTVREAAALLEMEVVAVETLIRQGHLHVIDGPTDARRRYLSRASVEAYAEAHPAIAPAVAPAVGTDGDRDPAEVLLTRTEAAKLGRLTSRQLGSLIATRQLQTAAKPRSGHVYITVSSLIAWAERTELHSIADSVATFANARRTAAHPEPRN